MKNIFSEIEVVENFLNGANDSEINRRRDLLNNLKSYILKGDYSSYSKKNIFLPNVYYGDEILAIKLDTTEASVRKIKSRFSRQLYELIGEDFLNKLKYGSKADLDELEFRLEFANSKTSSTNNFTMEFLSQVKNNALDLGTDYDIDNCKYELALLRWLNINRITDLLSGVDLDKITYIFNVMDGVKGSYEDRLNIYKTLKMSDLEFFNTYGRSLAKFPPRDPDVVGTDTM